MAKHHDYPSNAMLANEINKQYQANLQRQDEIVLENNNIRLKANDYMFKYNFAQTIIDKQKWQLLEME